MVYIYGLIEPGKTELLDTRYVGKANNPIRRLMEHVKGCGDGTHRGNWICSLLDRNMFPEVFILEEVAPSDNWQERERYWIAYLRSIGANLTNGTEGGEGGIPFEWVKEKIAHTLTGRKDSEATREKKSKSRMGELNPMFGKKRENLHMVGNVYGRLNKGKPSSHPFEIGNTYGKANKGKPMPWLIGNNYGSGNKGHDSWNKGKHYLHKKNRPKSQ